MNGPSHLGCGRDHTAGEKEVTHSQCLFPFESVFDRVLEAADGMLNLALYLVGLALRLQLGVTDRFADRLLDCTFDLLRRSDDPILIHDFLLQYLLNGRRGLSCKLAPNVYKITAPPVHVVDVDQGTFPPSIPSFCHRTTRQKIE